MDNSENYCIYTNIPYSKLKDREGAIDNSENYCIYTNIPYSKLKDREGAIEYGQFRELLYLHKYSIL